MFYLPLQIPRLVNPFVFGLFGVVGALAVLVPTAAVAQSRPGERPSLVGKTAGAPDGKPSSLLSSTWFDQPVRSYRKTPRITRELLVGTSSPVKVRMSSRSVASY